MLSLTNLI